MTAVARQFATVMLPAASNEQNALKQGGGVIKSVNKWRDPAVIYRLRTCFDDAVIAKGCTLHRSQPSGAVGAGTFRPEPHHQVRFIRSSPL